MTPEEVLTRFKSGYDVCMKLHIHPSYFAVWKKKGWIPLNHQLSINDLLGSDLLPIDKTKKDLKERLGNNNDA